MVFPMVRCTFMYTHYSLNLPLQGFRLFSIPVYSTVSFLSLNRVAKLSSNKQDCVSVINRIVRRYCRHQADKPRRRALQLFSEKVAALAEEGEDAAAVELAAAAAAAQLCALLPALLGQAGALSGHHSKLSPKPAWIEIPFPVLFLSEVGMMHAN